MFVFICVSAGVHLIHFFFSPLFRLDILLLLLLLMFFFYLIRYNTFGSAGRICCARERPITQGKCLMKHLCTKNAPTEKKTLEEIN